MNQGPVRSRRGLGDVVEVVAKPAAKMLGMPTDCLPCQKRKEKLNAISDAAVRKVNALGRRIFRGKIAT